MTHPNQPPNEPGPPSEPPHASGYGVPPGTPPHHHQAYPAAQGPAPGAPAVPGPVPPPFGPQAGIQATGKPGTVTGAQVLLWIIAGLAAVGVVLAVIGLATYVTAAGVIALAYGLYAAVQSSVCAVALGGGRRWAHIWALVSTIVNLVFAVGGFVTGMFYLKFTPVPFISGGIATALYGTLFGLLLARSLRQWVLARRVQRGEVHLAGMNDAVGQPGGPVPPAAAVGLGPHGYAQAQMRGQAPAQDRGPRPRSVITATVAVVAVGALWAWFVWNLIRAIGWYTSGENGPRWDFLSLIRQWWFWEVHGVVFWGGPIVLVSATITAILLWKGRAAGRVFGIVWLCVTLPALAYRMWDLTQYHLEFLRYAPEASMPRGMILGYVCLAVMVFALVMLFTPAVRRWTPPRPLTLPMLVVPGGYGQPPSGPPVSRGPYG